MDTFFLLLQQANDFLWGYIVITALVFCALFFTYKIRGVQFWMLRDMIKVMTGRPIFNSSKAPAATSNRPSPSDGTSPNDADAHLKKIGSFHAFAVSPSSRVGTGNLAGVASAIFVGGPGAVFWMWVMALFGAATACYHSS